MKFSFNRYGALSAVLGASLALCAPLGCTRDREATQQAAQAETRTRAADLIGVLKLVRQEYMNAVAPGGGTVVDETEYAETELFAEQAQAKVAELTTGGDAKDERAGKMRDGVARIHEQVTQKAPPAEVTRSATATIAIVEELLAGAVPDQIRGTVLATTRADQAVAVEEIVGEYRIGITSTPARQIFRREAGALVPMLPRPGDVYVAVIVRERRTKRFLPAQTVSIELAAAGSKTGARLTELWGDFHQYGGNLQLPTGNGEVTVTVAVGPPAYARHGDMLKHYVEPASATLQGHVRGGMLQFDAKPVQPVDPDYAVGDDVLQALAEAGSLRDAGPYRVGVIVEGPEPFWTWKDGAPVLAPVAPDATNHVEVVLLDRDTGQLVPDADVHLAFVGADGRELATAMLHPLLSVFSHYGQTLTLPAGTTAVRVHVAPPTLGSIDRPRLAEGADVEMPLPKRRSAA